MPTLADDPPEQGPTDEQQSEESSESTGASNPTSVSLAVPNNQTEVNANSAGIPCYNTRCKAVSYHYIIDNDGEFQAVTTGRRQYLSTC